MSKKFESVIASPMGDFVRSPLGVRDAGAERAVYLSSLNYTLTGTQISDQHYDEQLLALSPSDLGTPRLESRPPWWPSPHPDFGQNWLGQSMSGDANTVWYSAYDLRDFYGEGARYTIRIDKMTSTFAPVRSWIWPAPSFGNGFMADLVPFGTSAVLWGLGFVASDLVPYRTVDEMYLLELDPDTMAIRRSSNDLWAGLTTEQRAQRPFIRGGGGTMSRIWVALEFRPDPSTQRSIIREYAPDTFELIRQFDAPRSRNPVDTRRVVRNIGGDDDSIWISSDSPVFGNVPGSIPGLYQQRVSELPAAFSDENRTILQDELVAPWPYPWGIG